MDFQIAYERMLWTMKGRYPKAQLYCATIGCGVLNGQNMFPEYLNGNAFEDYNQAIRTAAQKYRCHLVDLAAMGVAYDSVDGIHPNARGMQQLAEGWIRGIEEEKKKTTHRKKKRSWTQWLIPVLLGVSFLSFLLMYVSPGDPVRAMYAVSGSIPSEEVLEQTREELGLNDPFFIQYGNWISNCLRGDFGTSYSKGEAVATLLMERVMPTIQLALLSLVIMVLVAVPIGVYSALRQNSMLDYLLRGSTFISISMPNFWVGLLLLYVVAMKLGWLPVVSNQMNFQRLIKNTSYID